VEGNPPDFSAGGCEFRNSAPLHNAGWKGETDYFVACTTTWGELMYRLKAVAEGKRPGPLFRMAEMTY